mmetsp:Transcript_118847/g.207018  ORF Transcript_118847/g.207018 Transcript_118847/m.207018 type:complete len:277 (-) Transcript_118847:3352-4182(-)
MHALHGAPGHPLPLATLVLGLRPALGPPNLRLDLGGSPVLALGLDLLACPPPPVLGLNLGRCAVPIHLVSKPRIHWHLSRRIAITFLTAAHHFLVVCIPLGCGRLLLHPLTLCLLVILNFNGPLSALAHLLPRLVPPEGGLDGRSGRVLLHPLLFHILAPPVAAEAALHLRGRHGLHILLILQVGQLPLPPHLGPGLLLPERALDLLRRLILAVSNCAASAFIELHFLRSLLVRVQQQSQAGEGQSGQLGSSVQQSKVGELRVSRLAGVFSLQQEL